MDLSDREISKFRPLGSPADLHRLRVIHNQLRGRALSQFSDFAHLGWRQPRRIVNEKRFIV